MQQSRGEQLPVSAGLMSAAHLGARSPSRTAVAPLVAGLLTLLLSPLLVFIGIAVLLESHGPITVRRAVVGANGGVVYVTEYRLWRVLDSDDTKVRTFRLTPDTVTGRILRATRLSRLPRLLDIKARRLTMSEALWN